MSSLEAQTITRQSRSNLAFAFACLPPKKRQDMTVFYAFCRTVDDIVDDRAAPPAQKRRELDDWKDLIQSERSARDGFEEEFMGLLGRYPIDRDLLMEILSGMEMDIDTLRYESYAQLEQYCYRVASAVGLVSIEIFEYTSPDAPRYAIELGHALQLTNILRDVAEDIQDDDRIYLPQEDMRRFGVSEENLRAGLYDDRFRNLMEFEADRAEERYQNAIQLLPAQDRENLRASRLMGAIYHALLQKMRMGGFRVFSKRYRLSKVHMLFLLLQNSIKKR